jgi:halogenation protein CepH
MASTEEFDLIIAGGGPGGSTLAAFVAMQGHRVLILEREQFPRYSIGESLLPSTVHGICGRLGIREKIINAGFTRKQGGCMRWGKNPEPWVFDFKTSRALDHLDADYAFQVERAKFDQILLDNARERGVDVRERHQVKELIIEDGTVKGVRFVGPDGTDRIARAKYVADATGNTSKLASHVGERKYSEFFRNVALFAYYEGAKRMPAPLQGNILCAAFKEGWFWFIPLSPTLTSVGAVVAKDNASKLKGDQEKVMNEFIADCPIITDMLSPAKRVTEGMYGQFRVRKDWSYTTTQMWKPGMVLIGDAACFIDPVLSTGVHLSTYSALLAARCINTRLKGQLSDDRVFTEMEKRYRHEYNSFYDFLVTFYDMHQDSDSYFWRARKVLNSEERSNEAFVRLVAGGQHPEEFFDRRANIGDVMQKYADKKPDLSIDPAETRAFVVEMKDAAGRAPGAAMHELSAEPPPDKQRWNGGLIATADGLHWSEPS